MGFRGHERAFRPDFRDGWRSGSEHEDAARNVGYRWKVIIEGEGACIIWEVCFNEAPPLSGATLLRWEKRDWSSLRRMDLRLTELQGTGRDAAVLELVLQLQMTVISQNWAMFMKPHELGDCHYLTNACQNQPLQTLCKAFKAAPRTSLE